MSELAIFIIGSVIFAITVAGVVLTGGVTMQAAHRNENPGLYNDGKPGPRER